MMDKKLIGIHLKSLLAGWVAIVFGTSFIVLIVIGSKKRYHTNNFLNSLRNTWETADEMDPAVKLSIVLILALFLFIARKILNNRFFYLTNIACALGTVLFVLAFLPEKLSRGYGIGVTGNRFDSTMTFIYLSGAVLGGLVYSFTYEKLLKHSK